MFWFILTTASAAAVAAEIAIAASWSGPASPGGRSGTSSLGVSIGADARRQTLSHLRYGGRHRRQPFATPAASRPGAAGLSPSERRLDVLGAAERVHDRRDVEQLLDFQPGLIDQQLDHVLGGFGRDLIRVRVIEEIAIAVLQQHLARGGDRGHRRPSSAPIPATTIIPSPITIPTVV